MSLHIERSIQFRSDLYTSRDRSPWFRAMGDELASRKLSLTLAPGLVIRNGDDAVALFQRYLSDKAGLAKAINLPASTSLENYFSDLVQAMDDCVKTTSDIKDKMIELGPTSEMAKLLGLDTRSRYASTNTVIGKAPVNQVFQISGVDVTRAAGGVADPLAGKLYMDSKTFAGQSFSWPRNGVELEQVYGVTGADAKELNAALRATNSSGRSNYQRLRRPESCEAYAVGYRGVGLDDLRWDSEAHEQREKNKYVSLTIEDGRYEPNEVGEREISVGTDKMDDTYYDTAKFDLLDADYSVRGRARWDTDTQIRRLLVQVKNGTVIDDFGLKRNGKVDVRNDGASAAQIASLDHDVRTGKSSWGGSGFFEPLKGVYDELAKRKKLEDIGPHQGVLMLEPKVHLRSVRSRYHLNETSLSALQDFHRQTTGKLQSIQGLIATAKPTLTGARLRTVTELETAANAIQDGSAIAAEAERALKALDPNMTVSAATIKDLMPNAGGSVNWNAPKDALTVEKKKVVAEAMDTVYHAFAEQLDGARRILCNAEDRTYEDYPALFRDWLKATDKTLINKNTYDPFLARYDQIAAKPAAEKAKDLKAFNDWALAQKADGNRDFRDFQALDDAGFAALRPQLLNEVVRINQRQLEEGGSTANALWYEEARSFYIPNGRRNTGNFIIDTTDMSEYVKDADWNAIPEAQRTPANLLPADKVFHTSLVNETQIELGLEEPYLNRLEELEGKIKEDRSSVLMKFFDSVSEPGVDKANPATYFDALKKVLNLPAAQRDARINRLNAFAQGQKSALTPVTWRELERLTPETFTAAIRDRAVRTDPTLEKQLEGAKFVFEQLIDVQREVVRSKEERVMDVLEDAGLNGIDWRQTETSKGNTALTMLREGRA